MKHRMTNFSRDRNTLSASDSFVMEFASTVTLAALLAATRAGATQVQDVDGEYLPRYGDAYDSGIPGLVVQSVNLTPLGGCQWRIDVQYATNEVTYKTSSTGSVKKPWDQKPQIVWQKQDKQVVMNRCYVSGDTKYYPTGGLRLPNGRPMWDPPMHPLPAALARISWATRTSIASAISTCEFTTNSAAITLGAKTLPIGTGYMDFITENVALLEDGTKYYTHETTVEYQPWGHAFRPVAMDYYAIIDSKLQRVKIKNGVYGGWPDSDADASPVTDPVYINSSGALMSTDPTAAVTPYVQSFTIRTAASWSALELD